MNILITELRLSYEDERVGENIIVFSRTYAEGLNKGNIIKEILGYPYVEYRSGKLLG